MSSIIFKDVVSPCEHEHVPSILQIKSDCVSQQGWSCGFKGQLVRIYLRMALHRKSVAFPWHVLPDTVVSK